MRYLTGVASNPVIRAHASLREDIGVMLQPRSNLFRHARDFPGGFAYDNGAFGAWVRGAPFDARTWRRGMERVPEGPLFAVVPDVVSDHEATRASWETYAPEVIGNGFRAAFVLQNGCTSLAQVPDDAGAVFIGGDDDYKVSRQTASITWAAREAGLWVHMGRVNTLSRWLRALAMGCHSADGTFLRFGRVDHMLARLDSWLDAGKARGAQLDALDVAVTA